MRTEGRVTALIADVQLDNHNTIGIRSVWHSNKHVAHHIFAANFSKDPFAT